MLSGNVLWCGHFASSDPAVLTMKVLWLFILLSLVATCAFAEVLHVPAEFPEVRDALQAASRGDTVLVAPGEHELRTPRDLEPDLTLLSEAGPTCTFLNSSSRDGMWFIGCGTHIEGFTFMGSSGYGDDTDRVLRIHNDHDACSDDPPRVVNCMFTGLGNRRNPSVRLILDIDGSAIVENCTFVDNYTRHACIWVFDSEAFTLRGCSFQGNYSEGTGVLYAVRATVRVEGCLIAGNHGQEFTGGVRLIDCQATFLQSTIVGNLCSPGSWWEGCYSCGVSGALLIHDGCQVALEECILAGNRSSANGHDATIVRDSDLTIECSAVNPDGIYPGEGIVTYAGENVFDDPMFVMSTPADNAPTALGDYRLQDSSPCLPLSNGCTTRIGTLGPISESPAIMNLLLSTPSYSGCSDPAFDWIDQSRCEDLWAPPIDGPAFLWIVANRVGGFLEGIGGAEFGISHEGSVEGWTLCTGGSEIPSEGWPDSGTGNAVTWPGGCYEPPAETARIGYLSLSGGNSGEFSARPDPRIGAALISTCTPTSEEICATHLGSVDLALGTEAFCGLPAVTDISTWQTDCTAHLGWIHTGDDIAGFEVIKAGRTIALLDPDRREYADSLANPGMAFAYGVAAVNGCGRSQVPQLVVGGVRPWAPTNLLATRYNCDATHLSWVDNADSEDGYDVYRYLHPNDEFVASLPPNTIAYADTTGIANAGYYYHVQTPSECEPAILSPWATGILRAPVVWLRAYVWGDTTRTSWEFKVRTNFWGSGVESYRVFIAAECHLMDENTLAFEFSESDTTLFFDEIPFDDMFYAWAEATLDTTLGCGALAGPSLCVFSQDITPVVLKFFTAVPTAAGISLEWETSTEREVAGFRVYRRFASSSEAETRVTTALIPGGQPAYAYIDRGVTHGETYRYRLVEVTTSGEEHSLSEITATASLPPGEVSLFPPTPNPSNPTTTLSFHVPKEGRVVLAVFDVFGRKIRTIVDAVYRPGRYTLPWDGRQESGLAVASGIYFARLRVDDIAVTQRIVLQR